jgi:hypothetical protein
MYIFTINLKRLVYCISSPNEKDSGKDVSSSMMRENDDDFGLAPKRSRDHTPKSPTVTDFSKLKQESKLRERAMSVQNTKEITQHRVSLPYHPKIESATLSYLLHVLLSRKIGPIPQQDTISSELNLNSRDISTFTMGIMSADR